MADIPALKSVMYGQTGELLAVMGAAALFTSGATFPVAVAASPLLFFVTSEKWQRRCFFSQKSGSASALFFKQIFCAAATANKLLPSLFSI